MGENVFDQYVNLFGSFNFVWIIVLIAAIAIAMVVVSIIKYNINLIIMKKSVKAAIKELIAEEEITIVKKEEKKDTNIQ